MPFIDAGGVSINFPFEPYDCQKDYMEKLIKCLKEGVNGILESPTGTGKTLCLLCSSCAWLLDKKAQITSQRYKLAAEGGGDALDFYKDQLAKELDQAAGAWSGELAAPKIIFASRTHSQLSQAVQELKRTAYGHLKVCVLGSREQLCIHPQVLKETSNTTKVHLCRAKVSARSCHFYNNVENGKGNFANQIMDIEDLVRLGEKLKCCPYYVSKELKAEADVIFMPYNYLLDPKTRKAHQVELNGNIVIFDEAHNLEKMCEDSASFDWTSADIASAIRDLKELSEKLASIIEAEESGTNDMDVEPAAAQDFTLRELLELKAQLHDLEKCIDEIKISKPEGDAKPGHFIFDLFGEANVTFQNKNHIIELLDKIITYLTSESTSSFHSKGSGLSKYADVLKITFSREPFNEYTSYSAHQKTVSKHYKVHIKENKPNPYEQKKKKINWDAPASSGGGGDKGLGRTLSYWCFSPGHTMEELKSQGVKSIILTSGTLSPLESFTTEMGIPFPVVLENPHVIEPHQVWLGICEKGPDGTLLNSSYENRFKESYQSSLGNAVVNFSRVVPHGLLLFFPSYPVMDKCLGHWQERNIWQRVEQYKPMYIEPRNKSEFHTAMINFYDTINDTKLNGAIFAAVCRGKVSEGLDFADNNGRAVVITGLPFPPRMDPKVVLKMQYLDEIVRNGGKGLTGQAWYRQQASRAVNQAIGRVIRHKDDFGAIILCDNRFSSQQSKSQLPAWLRPKIKVYQQFGGALKDMMAFFKQADKNMPAPRTKTRPHQGSGCEGASFPPTLASTSTKLPTSGLARPSTVVSHVPSLKPTETDEMSLARLKVQYEADSSYLDFGSQKKSLLDVFNSKAKEAIDVSGACLVETEYQKIKPTQEKGRVKKKIIIKKNTGGAGVRMEDSSKVTKDSLQTAEQYLAEVKKTLSAESYGDFSRTLAAYKKTGDFDTMVTSLAAIFTDSQHKHHLFIKFYRFVRTQHKEKFDRTCREMLGQGCGYKPEDSVPKKRLAESTDHGDEKKRKLEDEKTTKCQSIDSKSTSKSNTVFELTKKNPSQMLSATSSSSLFSSSNTSTSSVFSMVSQASSSSTDKINSTNSKENQSTSYSGLHDFSKQSCDKSAESQKDCKAVNGVVGNVEIENIGPAISNSVTKDCLVKPVGPSAEEVKKLLASQVSGYTCCLCQQNALIPLKAHCAHIACMECWKICIRESKPCPTCKGKVKRKHLSRIFFPDPPP